jgi:hypothetical protein
MRRRDGEGVGEREEGWGRSGRERRGGGGGLVEESAVELQATEEEEVLSTCVRTSHHHSEHLESLLLPLLQSLSIAFPFAAAVLRGQRGQGEVRLGIGRRGRRRGGEGQVRAVEGDPERGVWSLGLKLPVTQLVHLQQQEGA